MEAHEELINVRVAVFTDEHNNRYLLYVNIVDANSNLVSKWAEAQGIVLSGVRPDRIPGRGIGIIASRKVKVQPKLSFSSHLTFFGLGSSDKKKNRLTRPSCVCQQQH